MTEVSENPTQITQEAKAPKTKVPGGFKRSVCKLVMKLLGKGICYGYKVDSRIKQDVDAIGDDFSVKLTISPVGPTMIFGKKDQKPFSRIGSYDEEATMTISFKGLNSAFKMFTGGMGLAAGYAQHRFTVKGDLYKILAIVRIINIVEGYLFPKAMAKKLMNPIPPKQVNSVRFLCGTLF